MPNGVCKAKTCGPCQTCNPDTGVCEHLHEVPGVPQRDCVAKCNLCQTCNPATGVCTDKTCPNLPGVQPGDRDLRGEGVWTVPDLQSNSGLCQSTCDSCHVCRNNVCVPKCTDPCRPCNPRSGTCDPIDCDGECEVCQGGECVYACVAAACGWCDPVTNTCQDTCGPCTECDGAGNCVFACDECDVCVNGVCTPVCPACTTCGFNSGGGVICEPVKCEGECQACNPVTGQCEGCGPTTCTTCVEGSLRDDLRDLR